MQRATWLLSTSVVLTACNMGNPAFDHETLGTDSVGDAGSDSGTTAAESGDSLGTTTDGTTDGTTTDGTTDGTTTNGTTTNGTTTNGTTDGMDTTDAPGDTGDTGNAVCPGFNLQDPCQECMAVNCCFMEFAECYGQDNACSCMLNCILNEGLSPEQCKVEQCPGAWLEDPGLLQILNCQIGACLDQC